MVAVAAVVVVVVVVVAAAVVVVVVVVALFSTAAATSSSTTKIGTGNYSTSKLQLQVGSPAPKNSPGMNLLGIDYKRVLA